MNKLPAIATTSSASATARSGRWAFVTRAWRMLYPPNVPTSAPMTATMTATHKFAASTYGQRRTA